MQWGSGLSASTWAAFMQDWLTDADVQKWLNKYDWDSSGDICFQEFEALVRVKPTVLILISTCSSALQQQAAMC